MAKKPDNKETVTFEELLTSNTIEQEALVNLLVKKVIITKQELLDEIRRVSQDNHFLNHMTMNAKHNLNMTISILVRACKRALLEIALEDSAKADNEPAILITDEHPARQVIPIQNISS